MDDDKAVCRGKLATMRFDEWIDGRAQDGFLRRGDGIEAFRLKIMDADIMAKAGEPRLNRRGKGMAVTAEPRTA